MAASKKAMMVVIIMIKCKFSMFLFSTGYINKGKFIIFFPADLLGLHAIMVFNSFSSLCVILT